MITQAYLSYKTWLLSNDTPVDGGVDVSVMLNLLSKLSVIGSEL
jgi:hypothetical protein